MYASIKLKNFKCFTDEVITFRSGRNEVLNEVHLIGENGTGKSSIMSAFSFVVELTVMKHFSRISKVVEDETKKMSLTVSSLVSKYKTYNQSGCMEVGYEVVINRDKYFYDLKFNSKNELLKESLIKDNGEKSLLIFSNDSDNYALGHGIILKNDRPIFEEKFKRYSKDFTLLSIIHDLELNNMLNLKGSIADFLDFINLQQINTDDHNHEQFINFDRKYFNSPTHGICDHNFTRFLNASAILMSSFLKVVHPKIKKVKYFYEKVDDLNYQYEMYIFEEYNGQSIKLNRNNWPLSYSKSVSLCNAINNSYFNRVIIWDDISDNYHLDTIDQILMAFRQYSKRQLIFSSSSSVHLNNVQAQSIFLVKYEAERHFVENLTVDHEYRSEHNVKFRYEKRLYQKEKIEKDPRLFKLIDWFTKHALLYGEIERIKIKNKEQKNKKIVKTSRDNDKSGLDN